MSIVTAGLSPAWQQILVFDEIVAGEVNRAAQSVWCASGKTLNVARAGRALGADMQAVCPLGGWAGEAIRREFAADNIPARWVATSSCTRVCTTLIERSTGRATELVENAPAITAEELEAFEAEYAKSARSADLAVLTGSLPDITGHGKPVELYRRLMRDTPRAVLDVRGPELQAALTEHPLLIKPNREELGFTVGRKLADEAAILGAMKELNAAGAEWVLISAGHRDLLLTSRSTTWRLTPPPTPVVNPIGCGDCLAAGIAVAVDEGAEMVDALRFGVGAAAENLTQLLPARLDRNRVAEFASRVVVNSVGSIH